MSTAASDAETILGMAYQILNMLPADPDEAAPLLSKIGEVVKTRKPQQFDGWTGNVSHILSHLRTQDPETAMKALTVAALIVEDVRPHFAAIGRDV